MRRFKQVDVFTAEPFKGNPVAVVLDAEGLDTADMQRIARWTNLSETTFLQKSDKADYRVRIFTPGRELPFAGHPTIGSAHAALESGFVSKKDRLTQDCAAGVLELRVEGSKIFVRSPQPNIREVEKPVLGGRALRVDVGPVWLTAEVKDVASVDTAAMAQLSREHDATGVTVFDSKLHVRSFAPLQGIPEDPVCGSGNISVAAYLRHFGRAKSEYVASQGMSIGRDGRVTMRVDAGDIWLGGEAVTCVEGSLKTA
jgi:predicted PhzF superfamily epimerase YddE/YHI9